MKETNIVKVNFNRKNGVSSSVAQPDDGAKDSRLIFIERNIYLMLSKEFLDDRLGILPTTKNIKRMAAYIKKFEQEVADGESNK